MRELELSEQQLSGGAYVVQTPEKGRHDLIEVPAEEMQRLKSRGLYPHLSSPWHLCMASLSATNSLPWPREVCRSVGRGHSW